MKISPTSLPEVRVIEPRVFGDERGFFYESFNAEQWATRGIDFQPVQSNVSGSLRGVLRGLHYQWPTPQAKLVSVLEGEVFDVAVDIRRGSPTFGQWAAAVLTGENRRHLFVPRGFAHGFCVTSERAVFTYLCDAPYRREHDHAIRFDDAAIAIDWPIGDPQLSDKDAAAPLLAEIPADALPDGTT